MSPSPTPDVPWSILSWERSSADGGGPAADAGTSWLTIAHPDGSAFRRIEQFAEDEEPALRGVADGGHVLRRTGSVIHVATASAFPTFTPAYDDAPKGWTIEYATLVGPEAIAVLLRKPLEPVRNPDGPGRFVVHLVEPFDAQPQTLTRFEAPWIRPVSMTKRRLVWLEGDAGYVERLTLLNFKDGSRRVLDGLRSGRRAQGLSVTADASRLYWIQGSSPFAEYFNRVMTIDLATGASRQIYRLPRASRLRSIGGLLLSPLGDELILTIHHERADRTYPYRYSRYRFRLDDRRILPWLPDISYRALLPRAWSPDGRYVFLQPDGCSGDRCAAYRRYYVADLEADDPMKFYESPRQNDNASGGEPRIQFVAWLAR